MVRTRISRIFVFFMALVMLVNVSFSFEYGSFIQLKVGQKVYAAAPKYYYDKYTALPTNTGHVEYYRQNPSGEYSWFSWPNSTDSIASGSLYFYLESDGCVHIKDWSWGSQDPLDVGYGYYVTNNHNDVASRYYIVKEENHKTYGSFCLQYAGYAIAVRDYTCGTLVASDIIAESGTYPDNGKYSDGYWYIKKGIVNRSPTITAILPSQNQILSELKTCTPSITVSDPNGDTLTCKYYIDDTLMDTKEAYNTATAQTVSFSAPDISKITEGNRKLRFEVSDGTADPVTQTIDIIVDKSPPSIGGITAASDDSSITVSGSATDTVTDASALQYRYTVGSTVSDWGTATSWKAGALSPNTLYNVKFEARDSAGHIASSTKSVYTKAQTLQITVSNAKENSFDININDSNPTATQYQLMAGSSYVNASGALTQSPQWITLTGKKITVTGLSPNTQYAVKAKAKNSDGTETAFSEQKTGTTLALSPSGITSEPGINSIKITWNPVSNAKGYEISIDGDDTNCINVDTSTTYTHSELTPESSHNYKVRTKNSEGIAGPWSEPIYTTTLPNPPDTPVITNTETTCSAIKISWDAVAKATGYEIEADGKTIDAGSDTAYTDSGLQPDTSHKYRVRAKNAGGTSEWSAYTETGTLPLPPEVPSDLKGVATKNDITLTWSASDRAEGYEFEIDGVTQKLEKVTQYKHENLAANSTHTYKIRAFNRGGRSAWSSTQTITTWPEIPVAPTNIMATSEKDSITLTWYSSPFAESYDVQVDGNNTVNIKELSYTQKNLTAGTKHSYRLRAKNITGDGEWSSPVEISTLPEETAATTSGAIGLTNIAAVVTNKTITIAWQAAKPNVQYQVEADGQILDNGKDTVYNHTGLKPQSFHTYRVRTVDADGNGQWCAILALSTLPDLPGAPANLNAAASDTQIELSWTKEDSVSYEVEADGEVLSAGEAAGYVNNGLEPGTTHTYRVRGRNITGVTAWSDSITKSTTSPSYEVDCKNGEEFNFSLLAANIDDFGGMTFVVAYNPEQLEVQDLCGLTADNEKASGKIPGTNLTVKYGEGRIEFTVDESVAPGTNWSGEISAIVFKSKIDGKAGINYSIE